MIGNYLPKVEPIKQQSN